MMERSAADAERTFFLRVLAPGETVDPPFDDEPYAVLLWATEPTSFDQKYALVSSLVAGGCRFIACGGWESAAWEDAADEAATAPDRPDPVAPLGHVTTTSHDGEPPDEVAAFLAHSSHAGPHRLAKCLVLVIGDDARVREQLVAALRAITG